MHTHKFLKVIYILEDFKIFSVLRSQRLKGRFTSLALGLTMWIELSVSCLFPPVPTLLPFPFLPSIPACKGLE